jgi:hypothetical protein
MSKTITSAEYQAWLEHPLTKALKRSFGQSVTDPENQPSQYGTVTLEYMKKEIDAAYERAAEVCEGMYDKQELLCGPFPKAIRALKGTS